MLRGFKGVVLGVRNSRYGSAWITHNVVYVLIMETMEMMMMMMEDKFLSASTVVLLTVDMSVGAWPGRVHIWGYMVMHMHAWSPALMIQIIDYVIIIMKLVSQRVSVYCWFCFFRGIKAVVENLS